ncbi:hypothetical protein [Candidatus Poriferisodalis sp.]|uniref:hypothetical protein n=1 Tax=Candidatus Poriferisodalis sp. TaxID=3101277 RepID=UPI003B018710
MIVRDIFVAVLSRRRNAVGVVLAGFAFFVAACSGGVSSEDVDAAIGAAIAEHTQAHDTEIVGASEIAEMVRDEIREEAVASSRTSDSSPGGGDGQSSGAESRVPDASEDSGSAPDAAADAAQLSAVREVDPAGYTRYVVGSAMAMYDAEGLDATLAYYNDAASVDGQWYVFIVDGGGELIGHYDPERIGLDVNGWVGTDVNGYKFGPEILSADENGKWVPYFYKNPVGDPVGDFELKNAWVVRHDGLLFGSGWYVDFEQFLPALIGESADRFRVGGLEGILAFYTDPQGISAGLIPTVEYYNSTDALDRYFSGFIAAADGEILVHFDPGLVGTDIEDLLGPAVRNATAQGTWITADDNGAEAGVPESMRVWVVDVDGTLIGAGWYTLAAG